MKKTTIILAVAVCQYGIINPKYANAQPLCDGIISTDTITMTLHDGINCIDYPIVKIGSQWWMKENVNATLYSDSTSLVNGTGVGNITGNYTTKYFFNYNDSTSYSDIYGKLYTWAAAMNGAASSDSITSGVQGVCPTGWHLPSDAEWKQLEMNLGMSQASADFANVWRGTDEGGQLKDTGTTYWTSPNTGATNSSGFAARPSGIRSVGGTFFNVGVYGFWWMATESSATFAWYRYLYYTEARVYRDNSNKENGFSCRCVKDIDLFVNLTINYRDNNQLIVYPNPGRGKFQLSVTGNQYSVNKITVYNILGKEVETRCTLSLTEYRTPFTIDISGQPAGIYHLQIITDTGIVHRKLVIE